jgi:hypothetical protein
LLLFSSLATILLFVHIVALLFALAIVFLFTCYCSFLNVLLLSFSCYFPYVVICQKSLHYPLPFLFASWEQSGVDNLMNFFPLKDFFIFLGHFSSCLLILYSLKKF